MSEVRPTVQLIEAVRGHAPGWSARSADGERQRSVPIETATEILALGAHRLLQPRAFGGAQGTVRDHVEVVAATAEACTSAGWCLAVWSVHNWMAAQLDPQGQAEVWSDPAAAISASIVPRVKFTASEAGVEITGRFPFGSGADHAAWFGIGGLIELEGVVEPLIAFVPRSAVTIDQASWFVMGLSGTGSKDLVVAAPVVVPWQRVLRMRQVNGRQAAGQVAPAAALYRAPFRPVATLVLAPPALGAARAALARFVARLDGHALPFAGKSSQRQDAAARLRVAESSAQIDAAALVLGFAADECERLGKSAAAEPVAEARVGRDAAYAVRLCAQAVDRLYEAAGGSALAQSEPLQRHWRDVMAVRAHAVLTWDAAATTFADAYLG